MNYETRFAQEADVEISESAKQRRKRTIIIACVAAMLVIIALTIALKLMNGGAGKAAEGADLSQAPAATVVVPGRTAVERVVNATGSLAARREMPIGVVGEGGMVLRVLVEPGDWARAGQPLAVLERSVQTQESRALAAQIDVARADARLAQAELDRAQALVSRGFISKADIDRKTATRDAARARVGVAQAQYQEALARTGRLDIRVPAAGLVLTRNVEPGQVVSSSSGVLFRMAQGGEMEMLAEVSESDLAHVRPGMSAQVTPVGSGQSFMGRIWQVSPVVDPESRLGTARILLSYQTALRPGGFASARIVRGKTLAPMLPESAVLTDDKGSYVYTVNSKNEVERRTVQIGQVSSDGVAINQGLSGNEKVVLTAGAFLNPGQKIRPVLKKISS